MSSFINLFTGKIELDVKKVIDIVKCQQNTRSSNALAIQEAFIVALSVDNISGLILILLCSTSNLRIYRDMYKDT